MYLKDTPAVGDVELAAVAGGAIAQEVGKGIAVHLGSQDAGSERLGIYKYVCKCGFTDEIPVQRMLSPEEDNARPAKERPKCPKCGRVMKRSKEILLPAKGIIRIVPPRYARGDFAGEGREKINEKVDAGLYPEKFRQKVGKTHHDE